MGRLRSLVVISLGLAVPACALFTDLGDFSNGDRETGSADTGPSTPDTGDPIAEGGSPTLAGDADADADAAACGHLFCEDFDDDAGVSRWQTLLRDPNKTVTMRIDTATATSPPSSLLFGVSPARWEEWGYVQKVFDIGSAATFRCGFDIRLDEVPPEGSYTIGAIAAAEAESPAYVSFDVRGGGARIDLAENVSTDGGSPNVIEGPPLGVEQWRTFVVTLQRGANPTLRISDGVSARTLDVPWWPATPKLAFSLGVVFANPYALENARLHVRYDKVHCDAL